MEFTANPTETPSSRLCQRPQPPNGQFRKIFSKLATRYLVCFVLSRFKRSLLSGLKAGLRIIPRERSGHEQANGPRRCSDKGRQMGILGRSHAWRAIVIGCGLAWFAPAANLQAASLLTPAPAAQVRKSGEPFGLFAAVLTYGGLRDKWLGAERKIGRAHV